MSGSPGQGRRSVCVVRRSACGAGSSANCRPLRTSPISRSNSSNGAVYPTLVGIVEVDETLVGGKARAKGRGYRGNLTMVAGALQRDGKLRLERVPDAGRSTLHDFINRNVKDEAEAMFTDEWKAYLGIADDNTRHETVNRSAEQWVIDDVHTTSIPVGCLTPAGPGAWALRRPRAPHRRSPASILRPGPGPPERGRTDRDGEAARLRRRVRAHA